MNKKDLNTPKFSEREIRLIENCKVYAANDPAGLPSHNLMIIVAKLSSLLVGGELEEATEDTTPLDIMAERDIEAGEILEYKISGRRMRACTDQPVKAGQYLTWRPVIDYKPNERKDANAS